MKSVNEINDCFADLTESTPFDVKVWYDLRTTSYNMSIHTLVGRGRELHGIGYRRLQEEYKKLRSFIEDIEAIEEYLDNMRAHCARAPGTFRTLESRRRAIRAGVFASLEDAEQVMGALQ